jgi:hypothetical protein
MSGAIAAIRLTGVVDIAPTDVASLIVSSGSLSIADGVLTISVYVPIE